LIRIGDCGSGFFICAATPQKKKFMMLAVPAYLAVLQVQYGLSVQNWRTKWFYIKDQKSSEE
jgi:hypothetical protein